MQRFFTKALNLDILRKSRMPWVDYLRGIAIILVVYRHVLIGIERSGMTIPTVLEKANMIFFSFRMPLFFILSGLFISGSLKKRGVKGLISFKFDTILYPYIVWAFLQTTIQIILSNYTNAERNILHYTYILYQPRALDQFWYLPALFNATVVFLLLKTKANFPPFLQLAVGISLYFAGPLFRDISMISDWMEYYIFFAIGDVLSDIFFNPRTQSFLKRNSTALLTLPVFVATQTYYIYHSSINQVEFLIISLTGCFSMFVLSFRLQEYNILRLLRIFGYHSLQIYVMHVIFSAPVRVLLTRLLNISSPSLLLLCGIISGVVIPVIIYNLVLKEKAWFLFRYPHKFKKGPSID